jgi:hypothetical protein
VTNPEHLADTLTGRLREIGPLAVAYSGGADSALVLAAAVRGLGAGRVLAITAVSESLASGELEPARRLAGRLGARHLTVGTEELSRPGYRANGRDRCYFCKSRSWIPSRPRQASTATTGWLRERMPTTRLTRSVPASPPGVSAASTPRCSTPA